MPAYTVVFNVREGQEDIRGVSLWTRVERDAEVPAFPGVEMQCNVDAVDKVQMSTGHVLSVWWNKTYFGREEGDPHRLTEDRLHDIAVMLLPGHGPWLLRGEPTLDGLLGIQVINDEGKCLFIGKGYVVDLDEPRPHSQFVFTFEEVYNWVRASPLSGCTSCRGSQRREFPEARPDYGAPDGGRP
ncbi:hypothetical protein WJ438_40185 [Streptomyces sp. GD-15H]|uniref:hypothetical protein n=1 Tax=Streptomyces sp. GD-15H TaxID=3129112 RepID=UPI00324C9F4A